MLLFSWKVEKMNLTFRKNTSWEVEQKPFSETFFAIMRAKAENRTTNERSWSNTKYWFLEPVWLSLLSTPKVLAK